MYKAQWPGRTPAPSPPPNCHCAASPLSHQRTFRGVFQLETWGDIVDGGGIRVAVQYSVVESGKLRLFRWAFFLSFWQMRTGARGGLFVVVWWVVVTNH